MKFSKLNLYDKVQKAIEEMGYHKTTDIQYKAIRSILTGSDVLAIAQTGTGKTAAYLIPIIHRLCIEKRSVSKTSALIMVPTRELAIQVGNFVSSIAKYTSVRAAVIYGGVTQDDQIEALQNGAQLLICTPGRFFDLKHQGYIHLEDIQTFVIDEADQMLKFGFYKDIMDINRILPFYRQTLYFSATIDAEIKKLAYSLVKNPIRIELSPTNPISPNITHYKMKVVMDDKRFFLERLINEYPDTKIMVFLRTQVRAERVQAAMLRIGMQVGVLHGGKEQSDRLEVLDLFRQGEVKVLLATDVAARGIDIPNVDVVVNYDVPDVTENYVHRIGRTGRGTAKGTAFTFFDEGEQPLIDEIEEYITDEIDELNLDEISYKEVKEIKDPNKITMKDINKMVTDIDTNFDAWQKNKKQNKIKNLRRK